MFICLNCGALFENPKIHTETHGLDSPPFEKRKGCPICTEAFVETPTCDMCGEYITEDYCVIGNKKYCNGCYTIKNLGE